MTQEFDLCGKLPSGVTVLEASAGTGKTFTIAGLAARYIAEGVPLEQLLLVTFTRMATGELRERVRERLLTAEQRLTSAMDGGGVPDDDELVAYLAQCDVRTRRDNLTRALAGFDGATIATTHQFSQEVLGGLGVIGDLEPDTTFVEDISDLRREVVEDLYLRKWSGSGHPQFDFGQAMRIATAVIDNPDARIEPQGLEYEKWVAAVRVSLAESARRELDRRKRLQALMTFDDQLTRLEGTLTGPGGDDAAARLRERYSVVLVDEFQDTDPIQWTILERAFGTGETTLILIGDPKQAIYAFRGADVYAYLRAAQQAETRATLQTNHRSDQDLLTAYDALFGGAQLGHPGIVYRKVRAAPANRTRRLHGAPVDAALRIRTVATGDVGMWKGAARVGNSQQLIARDLAADVVRLLDSGARIEGGRTLSPGDIAVLVRTNHAAARMRYALEDVGVPAVINGAGSVFGTHPAWEWLRLLEALERPSQQTRVRSVALTDFLGRSPEDVAQANDEEWEDVHQRLHRWAQVLRLKGVASLVETISAEEGLPARILARIDGERDLTDLRHVGEILHATATTESLGPSALTAWLRDRIREAAKDTFDEERSRRLESDAQAVQVLTIHRSKGLEFPVVYLPDAWEPSRVPEAGGAVASRQPVVYHDEHEERAVDVGLEGPEWRAHVERAAREQRGEDLRLLYVALTRAKHQAVVWWAGAEKTRGSAFARLLFWRDDDGTVAPEGPRTPDDGAARARLQALRDAAPGCISVEDAAAGAVGAWVGDPGPVEELDVARFERTLDRWWRRTSYSGITADAHEARVASEPEETVVEDEPSSPPPGGGDDGSPMPLELSIPSLLARMPVGPEVGTLIHRVLEETEFDAPDLEAELRARVAAAQARRRVELGDLDHVVRGLAAALSTPLGAAVGDLRLREVARRDRLDELTFELPVVGGDSGDGTALTLGVIADVLRRHGGESDALAGYAERLSDSALKSTLRGYLTGSIDLVVRLPDGRFAIADHKTNWLAPPGEELLAWHHRPVALAAAMHHAHYGLQALLYVVALHRFLRWRVRGYLPDTHLAGVLYLFVRGMLGETTPVLHGAPCGVWSWQPSGELVIALSDALDRGEGA